MWSMKFNCSKYMTVNAKAGFSDYSYMMIDDNGSSVSLIKTIEERDLRRMKL